MRYRIILAVLFFITLQQNAIYAEKRAENSVADTVKVKDLNEIVIKRRRVGTSGLTGPETGFQVNKTELFRAACCNLGEAFTTNPSVDVDYADPATGARQIKLLGLAGQYVQMMGENLPAFRGAAMPYAFRYIPGPWLKSIRVSKGASSVKNGYEAISGAIDVEYLKPQDEEKVNVNLYLDSELRAELNADANFHLREGLNTELLAHYEDRFMLHDGNNDGFADMPDIKQLNLQNRWNYFSERYIMHAGISFIDEMSRAGQILPKSSNLYAPFLINLDARRYETYMKHALILDKEHNTNIAFAGNFAIHKQGAIYGKKSYDVNEKSAYGQLMLETEFSKSHSLSAGLSVNHDFFRQWIKQQSISTDIPYCREETETTSGGYAQYTFKQDRRFSAMLGVRGDYSNLYGWFLTPRGSLRYMPMDILTIKASAGKGYRTVHPWAEFNYLLSSGRKLIVENLQQEEAWNFGGSLEFSIPIGANNLKLNAEYFYTNFLQQAVIDYDKDYYKIYISSLKGKSYSHTMQIDASYEFPFGLTAMAAYRINDVKTTYNGILTDKILTSPYKGLITIGYKTPLELWQFDATFVINGGGRMPTPYQVEVDNYGEPVMSWDARFPTFPTLNFQATRWFRHSSVYLGIENLTNFRQSQPIINASDPWSSAFDPTLVWGPTRGTMVYAGVRYTF